MHIQRVTTTEMLEHPEFTTVTRWYMEETSLKELPFPKLNLEWYKALEAAGLLIVLSVTNGPRLCGFGCLVLNPSPHYGVRLGIVDAVYILPEFRSSRAGLMLLKKFKELAVQESLAGYFINAQVNSPLDKLLQAKGENLAYNSYFINPK